MGEYYGCVIGFLTPPTIREIFVAKSRAVAKVAPSPQTPALQETKAPLAQRKTSGDVSAIERFLPEIYESLRRIAHSYMRQSANQTLQPTALVHEAVLKGVAGETLSIEGKTHLLALCAKNMRRILVDHHRRRVAMKRGGARHRVELVDGLIGSPEQGQDVLVLDETLQRLTAIDARQAELVELRVFGGLTVAEAAQVMGISKRTAEREWTFAKAWLRREFALDDA